jgi:hypothetical protein
MDTITCSGHGDLIKLPVSLGAAARFLLTITIVVHTDSLFRTTMGAGQRTISASADHRHNPHERVPLTHVRAGAPPSFRTADPLGSSAGKDREIASNTKELLSGIP